MPYWTVQYYGYIVREPLVAAIPVGIVFAYVYRLKNAVLPLVAAAAMTSIFVIGPVFGLPLIGRYLRTPAELLSLFYGLAVCGFLLLPARQGPRPLEDRRRRLPRRVGALPALALRDAARPAQPQRARLQALRRPRRRSRTRRRSRPRSAQCRPLSTADHRPIPFLRYWLGGDPGSVGTTEAHASPLGKLHLVPRRSIPARRFYGQNFPKDIEEAGGVPAALPGPQLPRLRGAGLRHTSSIVSASSPTSRNVV